MNAGRHPKRPDPIDAHVGSRIRKRRTLLGISQGKLGEFLGITFQQVQKYETGTNRIGAGRLYRISQILEVPVSFFYEGYEEDGKTTASRGAAADPLSAIDDRNLLDALRAFSRIRDPELRQRTIDLLKALADAEKPPS